MSAAKKRVLVIEPEDNLLEIFRILLHEDGYEAHTTKYVNFPKILEFNPDVVFLAHNALVGGETKDVLAIFNRVKLLDKVVLMTTSAPGLMKREFPGMPVVYKPFHIEELKPYL